MNEPIEFSFSNSTTIPIISSSSIHPSSSSVDPFYRYQMPVLSSEILTKHQTLIHNLPEVAHALNREPIEILKFFSIETSSRFHHSILSCHSSNHRYILSGRYSSTQLQQLLSEYLELYVICPHCSLPDTFYKIKRAGNKSNGKVSLVCQVCGLKSRCDQDHKLSSFIVKQFQRMKGELTETR